MNKNSFIPALKESERFINFLNEKFKLNLPKNYVITINKSNKNNIGFFMNKESKEKFTNSQQDLNNINLNTYYLKSGNPYEVLAHELAHFINYNKKVKDVTSNQYHNKHFKKTAEMLLLKVESGKKGFSETKTTEEFDKMLNEFKKDENAFDIFQNQKERNKAGTRMFLFMCGCGVKIRCGVKELKAMCKSCNSDFVMVEGGK